MGFRTQRHGTPCFVLVFPVYITLLCRETAAVRFRTEVYLFALPDIPTNASESIHFALIAGPVFPFFGSEYQYTYPQNNLDLCRGQQLQANIRLASNYI
jgi:hypothetical protein